MANIVILVPDEVLKEIQAAIQFGHSKEGYDALLTDAASVIANLLDDNQSNGPLLNLSQALLHKAKLENAACTALKNAVT